MSNIRRSVEDLGVAAFLRMHGFKVVGRKGKNVYFEFDSADEGDFNKNCFEYVNSPFHEFDSHLMSLKKIREYLPD